MTTTTADVFDQAAANLAAAHQRIADHRPLPTAEDLAGPMIRTVLALHDLGKNGLAHDLEFLDIDQRTDDENWTAWQLVGLLEEVAELVVATVERCSMAEDAQGVGDTLRTLVFNLAEARLLRRHMYGMRALDIADGMHRAAS